MFLRTLTSRAAMRLAALVLAAAAATLACLAAPARAQPVAAPQAAASAAEPARRPQQVEITGGRETDTDQRRQSTAAKIVIGREEIERFGDATLGEVLRRLPGVTTPGGPGRGGAPRMRGLGGGFTQLLIDGQRLPPGFSLETLTPEQVERIEILRAPTAETGARAIAGTINIVTREGYRRRHNDWRFGVGIENGEPGAGSFWTHNDSSGDLTYTLSAGLNVRRRADESHSDTWVTDVASGALVEQRHTDSDTHSRHLGLNVNARLQWRLGEDGDNLVLMPGFFSSRNRSRGEFETLEALRRPQTPEFAHHGSSRGQSSFFGPRLMLQWRRRLGDWRLEGGGQLGASRSSNENDREELRADDSLLRTRDDRTDARERRISLNLKGRRLLGAEGAEHSLVTGAELELARREDSRVTLDNGRPTLDEFGDSFQSSTRRVAVFAQDEWSLGRQWAFHFGLRGEGITTIGDDGLGQRPSHRSSVWTPLLHLLWKPDPARRDQVRLSLTRSWRSPEIGSLIGRPLVSTLYDPARGSNTETSPDAAGNPFLRPELATGVDLAFERYLPGGGLLSANLFARRISDLMRSRVELEPQVAWSLFPRWVRRTRNIGGASTRGLELEAKFRLDQWITDAPAVEVRANLAFYRSQVDEVPGPDNRLDQQSRATANLGADYRFRGLPLTVGGNVNWVPSTVTRLAADQYSTAGTKRQWDAFMLWAFSPSVGVRLLANNLLPRDTVNTSLNDSISLSGTGLDRTRFSSSSPSWVNWQLRWELKL